MSDGRASASRFDRWGLEGETLELAVLRGMSAGRNRYLALVTLDFVVTFLESQDPASPPLDGRRVPELVTQPIDDGPLGTLAVSYAPDGVFVASGVDESTGVLRLARGTRFTLADGHHRLAAIRRALSDDPRLAQETVGLELFAHDAPARPRWRTGDPPGVQAVEAVRLTALNMALSGHSRDEVDAYLTDNFDFADNARLLDQVYATGTE